MNPFDDATSVERRIFERASKRQVPVNGSIELTPLCNMNCSMCYVRLDYEAMMAQGRLRTAEEWLDIGRQMQKAGVLFLLLTGGEPLLYPEFKKVYLGLRELGFVLTINTNATLIDEEWADFFGKYPPRRINVSIYGASARAYEELCGNSNGYEKAMRGINLLLEKGVSVKAAQSVTRVNAPDVKAVFARTKKSGIPCSCDVYMMPAVRERGLPFCEETRLGPEEAASVRFFGNTQQLPPEIFPDYVEKTLDELDQEEERENSTAGLSCLAGSCSFAVNWQGKLRPCVMLTEPAASVFEESFEEAWKKLRSGVAQIRTSVRCSKCKKRFLCRTCAAAALYETGDTAGTPSYLCRFTDEYIRLLRKYRTERKEQE